MLREYAWVVIPTSNYITLRICSGVITENPSRRPVAVDRDLVFSTRFEFTWAEVVENDLKPMLERRGERRMLK